MSERHFAHWPRNLPHRMTIPETGLFYNVEVSAQRFPDKPYLIFYDTPITFARFKREAEQLAAWFQYQGVRKGDRVVLLMQNSPQFIIAYYAILRVDAVVVPLNPMNLTEELRHYVSDSGAKVAVVARDLYPRVKPLIMQGLDNVLVATYSDYIEKWTDLEVPDFVKAPCDPIPDSGVALWSEALARARSLPLFASSAGPDDICLLPYTSGTTGGPKGAVHTHRSAMFTLVSAMQWFGVQQDAVCLGVLPFFHVTGMQFGMNGPLFVGGTVVVLARWDPQTAAQCIERYGVTCWTAISTMLIAFLSSGKVDQYDLSSLKVVNGGGAAMPAAIAHKMLERGIIYLEGYGLTETIAQTHLNPVHRPKQQCAGMPIFATESRVVDPETLQRLPPGEVGEIVTRGPQLFQRYWNDPAATREAFVEIDGERWFRTGDLGRVDEEGYFFIVDRLKRMINASGFKVWPAEVEAFMYRHPAVEEACVVAARDELRGETVKAIIVLKPHYRGRIAEREIIEWARGTLSSYKSPRIVEFVDSLPKSASGKILWRLLQETPR
jgi:fatty-acyl-CoA synthase